MTLSIKIVWVAMLLVAILLFSGSYVTLDAAGRWWACDEYQLPTGPVTSCRLIRSPFLECANTASRAVVRYQRTLIEGQRDVPD